VLRSALGSGDAPPQQAAPRLGQHTDELLCAAGMATERLDALRSRGVIL
jgi:crotonobetainyl-CoA:carnitine CoA-transferase CaiB-like acyl-CoA transferase